MAVLAKMQVHEKAEQWGSEYPPEHYEEDHWFTSMAEIGKQVCACEPKPGISSVQVKLSAVYNTTVGHPNHLFWQATPSGTLELSISNPDAAGFFETGVEYYVEIRKARK